MPAACAIMRSSRRQPMKTRTFRSQVLCNFTDDLSAAQIPYVQKFSSRDDLIARFKSKNCDWTEADVAPRAHLRMTIKVGNILQHNPNEGVWVYGASDADIDRLRVVLGDLIWTSRGNKVEGFVYR
jgi:hypothetical protein